MRVKGVIRVGRIFGAVSGRRVLDNVGLRVIRKRVCKFLKPGNTKGAALVGYVLSLSAIASNDVRVFKGGLRSRERRVLDRIKDVVRAPVFCSGYATGRVLRVRTRCVKGGVARSSVVETLEVIKLGGAAGGMGSFSLKVERELNLTHTFLAGPGLLVLSRPVGNLSPVKVRRVQGLLLSLSGRRKVAVLVSDRVLSRVSRVTSGVNIVGGKRVMRRISVGRVEERGVSLRRCFVSRFLGRVWRL